MADATNVTQSFYKVPTNGQITYQLLPDYQNNTGYQKATADEVNAEIARATPLATNDAWYKNYLTGLQQGLKSVANQSTSPYAVDPTTGNLTTKTTLADQQAQQQAIASGTEREIAPGLTVPVGSAGDFAQKGMTEAQQLAQPTVQQQVQQQNLQPVLPVTPTPQTTVAQPANPQGVNNISQLFSVVAPGQTSDQVKQLQQALINAGFNIPAGATGYYGPQTQAAVQQWQSSLNGQAGLSNQNGASGVTGSSSSNIADATAPQAPQGTSPSDFIANYKKALSDLGIPDIKAEFDKVVKEYSDLQNEMNGKIADIQDNPWMTQGVKDRNIEQIKNRYATKLDTLTNQQQLYDSLYKEGIAQAQYLTTGESNYQQNLADLALKAHEAAAKLDTQIVDVGGRKILVNAQTGATIKDFGASTSSSSTSASGDFNTTYQRILNGAGNISDLTPTEQQKVENKLYTDGFYNSTPPAWFKTEIENQLKQSVVPTQLATLWEKYRNSIISTSAKTTSGSSSGSIDFNNL